MTGLPLVLLQQLQQNIHRHGDAGFIHVVESHAKSLSTRLPDRSHHLAQDGAEKRRENTKKNNSPPDQQKYRQLKYPRGIYLFLLQNRLIRIR